MCARYYRCHSYCWTNWKTGKGSEKLLQEVLAAGHKIQHSNSGKNTINNNGNGTNRSPYNYSMSTKEIREN